MHVYRYGQQAHRKQLQIGGGGGAHIKQLQIGGGGAHIFFFKMTDLCNGGHICANYWGARPSVPPPPYSYGPGQGMPQSFYTY